MAIFFWWLISLSKRPSPPDSPSISDYPTIRPSMHHEAQGLGRMGKSMGKIHAKDGLIHGTSAINMEVYSWENHPFFTGNCPKFDKTRGFLQDDKIGLKATNMSIFNQLISASILVHPLKKWGQSLSKIIYSVFIKHGWKNPPENRWFFCHGDVRDVPSVTFPEGSAQPLQRSWKFVMFLCHKRSSGILVCGDFSKDGNVFLTALIQIHPPWGWGL